jgi:hypothetical protein
MRTLAATLLCGFALSLAPRARAVDFAADHDNLKDPNYYIVWDKQWIIPHNGGEVAIVKGKKYEEVTEDYLSTLTYSDDAISYDKLPPGTILALKAGGEYLKMKVNSRVYDKEKGRVQIEVERQFFGHDSSAGSPKGVTYGDGQAESVSFKGGAKDAGDKKGSDGSASPVDFKHPDAGKPKGNPNFDKPSPEEKAPAPSAPAGSGSSRVILE